MRATHPWRAVLADQQSAVPWMRMTDVGCGAVQASSSCMAESGPIAAKIEVLQASAYAIMPPLLMQVAYARRVDGDIVADVPDDRGDEPDVVDALSERPAQRSPEFRARPKPSG